MTGTSIIAGTGISILQHLGNVAGQSVHVSEIGLDTFASCIDPQMIAAYSGNPGQVLGIDEAGNACWRNPFDSDKELREKYPALEESWGVLMEALTEYQLVKKLVQDHNK